VNKKKLKKLKNLYGCDGNFLFLKNDTCIEKINGDKHWIRCMIISSGSKLVIYPFKLNKTGLLRGITHSANNNLYNLKDTFSIKMLPIYYISVIEYGWYVTAATIPIRSSLANLHGYYLNGNNQYSASPIDYRGLLMENGSALNLGFTVGYSIGRYFLGPQVNENEWAVSIGFAMPFTPTQLSKEPLKDVSVPGVNITNIGATVYTSPSLILLLSSHGFGFVGAAGLNYMLGQYSSHWMYEYQTYLGLGLTVTLGH